MDRRRLPSMAGPFVRDVANLIWIVLGAAQAAIINALDESPFGGVCSTSSSRGTLKRPFLGVAAASFVGGFCIPSVLQNPAQ